MPHFTDEELIMVTHVMIDYRDNLLFDTSNATEKDFDDIATSISAIKALLWEASQ